MRVCSSEFGQLQERAMPFLGPKMTRTAKFVVAAAKTPAIHASPKVVLGDTNNAADADISSYIRTMGVRSTIDRDLSNDGVDNCADAT